MCDTGWGSETYLSGKEKFDWGNSHGIGRTIYQKRELLLGTSHEFGKTIVFKEASWLIPSLWDVKERF